MKRTELILFSFIVLCGCPSERVVTAEIDILEAEEAEGVSAEDEEVEEVAEEIFFGEVEDFIPEKGGFLYPCETNEECLSGFCVEGAEGFFCTIKCLEECPDGFACQGVMVTWPDVIFICMPILDKTCQPCKSDLQCSGGRCIPLEDKKYCLNRCPEEGCPEMFTCEEKEDPLTGELVDFCVPVSGSCSCIPQTIGTSVVCKKSTEFSICYGVQFCEEDGFTECILPPEVCDAKDNNCDGRIDEDFVDSTGKYVADNHCGMCNNNCAAMNYPNSKGVCNKEKAVPDCAIECNKGFFDLNKNSFDGCECHFTSETDYPDGVDQNCDFVDGDIEKAVFVAKNGSDSNEGTIEKPLLTVQAGINLAHLKGLRDVYVATGVYLESIELKQGIGVYGGYSSDFQVRDSLLYETVIFGQPQTGWKKGAVNAVNISVPFPEKTLLDGFIVFGSDAILPGQSSYAVYIYNSNSQLVIRNNRIITGKGAPGIGGGHGLSGSNGMSGGDGIPAFDIGKKVCNATNPGGAGGKHFCGAVNVNGGSGGSAICPDFDESVMDPKCPGDDPVQTMKSQEKGENGKNNYATHGKGGDAGYDQFTSAWYGPYVTFPCLQKSDYNCFVCYIPKGSLNGIDGTDGTSGVNGSAGLGCLNGAGQVINGEWIGYNASAGGEGSHGGGGGGGGAGGGVETYDCENTERKFTDIGGSGGGGGSGGCGAGGGGGGMSGGGSFAVFIYFESKPSSIPSVYGNVIVTNSGGAGGNGGNGGVGGKGGTGGFGGKDGGNTLNAKCAPKGGHGGNGGNGGHGGGGGGGCGGISYGIFSYGHSSADMSGLKEPNNTFILNGSGGAGGTGGASLGNPGSNGMQGASGKTNF